MQWWFGVRGSPTFRTGNGQNIPPDEALVTRLLADADYICGLVGKLHITAGDADAGLVAESRIDDGYAYYHWSPKTIPDWRDVYGFTPTNAYTHWLLEKGLALPYRAPLFREVQIRRDGHRHRASPNYLVC